MSAKKNILFVVPDGVGVRNYLYSDILRQLKDKANLFFWTTLPDAAIKEVEAIHGISASHNRFSLSLEPARARIYREAATYARIRTNAKELNNPTILYNWKKNKPTFKLKALYAMAEYLGNRAMGSYDRILKLEQKSRGHWKGPIVDEYVSKLKQLSPDVLFISHQRVASLAPICLAAQQLGIKVASCIYSWDNTVKASLAIKADAYLVWSDYMKDEFCNRYPEIDSDQVVVTGTPQFEFYYQQDRLRSKTEFASTYKLDLTKKWICFSGDDEKTSPYDPGYLNDVAEAVSRIPDSVRPQLIFRRCPVDSSGRYDQVLQKYENLIVPIDPIWHTKASGWGTVYPKQDDVSLLVNMVKHCELVINIGSTMAHDFAVYDKPAFYLNYDQVEDPDWSVEMIYQFQHFRSLGDLDGVGWLNNKEEIQRKLQEALENPNEVAKDRKEWLARIAHHPLDKNSEAIANFLLHD